MDSDSPAVYLGIDSATSYLALALWSPGKGTFAHFCEEVGRDHAKRLIPELDALLRRGGVTRSQLHGIGVGVGPGSYTGLRVGIAAAKGLARALSIPVSGHTSLAAIAYRALSEAQQGIIALDARRGNVYAGRFRRDGEDIERLDDIVKTGREALQAKHPDLPYIENAPPDAGFLARQAYRNPQQDAKVIYM